MTENPDDWRCATDPNSGKSYWYHRRTRISTWTRPNFIELVPQPVAEIVTQPSPRSSGQHEHEPDVLRFYPDHQSDLNSRSLEELFDAISFAGSDHLSCNPALLADLVGFIASNPPKQTRLKALKCIWKLSTSRIVAMTMFQSDQSWTDIHRFAARWDDQESIIALSAILSNLSIGPTYTMLQPESMDFLAARLDDLLARSADSSRMQKPIVLGGAEFIIDESAFGCYLCLAQKGHAVSALLLCIVAAAAIREERVFISAISCNILPGLQAAAITKGLSEVATRIAFKCISYPSSQNIRRRARTCLLNFMNNSSYAREKVLDAFLEVSATVADLPAAAGPEPALYQHEIDLSDEAVVEMWSNLRDDGGFEVIDRTPEVLRLERMLLQRDVEWIPQSGTSWHLCSSLLWARCPALHEIIQGFWEDGGGGLELTIDCCDQVVAAACAFIHTGLLRPPPHVERQLELLRVSSQLSMPSLQKAVEDVLAARLSSDNVDTVLAFAEDFDYPVLANCSRIFQQTGKRPVPIHLDSKDSSSSLKSAIAESLQDVGNLLNQTASPHNVPSLAALAAVSPHLSANNYYGDDLYDQPVDPVRTTVSGKQLKPKSGGIYSLLLQSQGGGPSNEPPVVAPLDASKMPGRVMKGGKQQPKDRPKRPGHLDISLDSNRLDDLMDADDSIHEYRPTMSLEPLKEKSEREKKWERMSQPKAAKEAKEAKPKPKPEEPPQAEEEEEEVVKPATKPATKPVAVVKPSKLVVNLDLSQEVSQSWDRESDGQVTPSSSDGPPKNVRSSLALLKAKTVRGRRRGSLLSKDAADEEGDAPASFPEKAALQEQPTQQPLRAVVVNDIPIASKRPPQPPQVQYAASDHEDDGDGDGSDQEYQDAMGDEDDAKRLPCPDCGRRFLPQPLAKHVKICQKVFQKKRKQFDSAKMRVEGIPELKELNDQSKKGKNRLNATKAQKPPPADSKSKWKAQSEQFREAMRAIKDSAPTNASAGAVMAPPKPYVDPTLVECPHCQRRYNDKAAERHIPLCKDIIAKPSKLRKGAGQTASASTTPIPRTPGKKGWQ